MAKDKAMGTRTSTEKPPRGNIHVDFKINILHTIADAIYATAAGKVREAVANSRDNGASWVVIVLDQTKSLSANTD